MQANEDEYRRMNETQLLRQICNEFEITTNECAAKAFAIACNCSEQHIYQAYNGQSHLSIVEWIAVAQYSRSPHFNNFIEAKKKVFDKTAAVVGR